MAAKKEVTIVIKKITAAGAGHHGGAWKVALADFMTALMAFFLTMWLLSQNDETKKAVADHFSTPSIIEYNFSTYGVEITLEKLFLDLVNEPLKALQQFMEPVSANPNLLDLGSKRVILSYIADQLQDSAKNVSINGDTIEFDIPDYYLFQPGVALPNDKFVEVMEKIKALTTGLKDAEISVYSLLFNQSVTYSDSQLAKRVASERLDVVKNKIQASLGSDTVSITGGVKVQDFKNTDSEQVPNGFIRLRFKQKEERADGSKPRKIEALFDKSETDMAIYESFVKQISEKKKNK